MNKISKIIEKPILWSLTIFSLIAIYGSVIYRLYRFNSLGLLILLLLLIATILIILNLGKNSNKWHFSQCLKEEEGEQIIHKKEYIFILLYLLAAAYFLSLVIRSQTVDSIISPWEIVPKIIFIIFFALNILAFCVLKTTNSAKVIFLSLHYFIAASIIIFVYKLGYGFDSFVHQASLEHIDKFSEITPKPLYYLGYYSLIIFFNKFLFIPIELSNHILVPVLSALALPYFLTRFNLHWFKDNSFLLAKSLILLILPFSFFTHSLPQNLAFLFLLLLVLFSTTVKSKLDYLLLGLLALSTMVIHPISGIPALLYILIFLYQKQKKVALISPVLSLVLLLNTILLPILFAFLNHQTSGQNSFNIKKAFSFNQNFLLPNQESVILNTSYFWNNYSSIVIILSLGFGVFVFLRHRKQLRNFYLLLWFFISSLLSFFLTRALSFSYLTNYEQSNFSSRLLLNSLFFALPFLIIAIHNLALRFKKQNLPSKIIITTFLSLTICVNFYLNYPRLDNYHNSHGLSVGKSDIKAVKWIEKNAQDDYVVLANQQVSAASLVTNGFKKYYPSENEEIFYYPIPTSGKLYKIYLDMVYEKPSKENAKKAKDLTGANQVYFVLNKYWWAFDKIKAEAKIEAKGFESINNDEIIIFWY